MTDATAHAAAPVISLVVVFLIFISILC